MSPKVSIIVPIYNMKDYLERCLQSLLGQTLEEIEIIAVNDGSTDGSLETLITFASKDSRLKVINQPNNGVSAARNAGLKKAAGIYIGFVDPDDWVDRTMYESLYKTATIENADIVMCTYIREFNTHSKEKVFNMADKELFIGEEIQSKILRRLIGPLNEEIGNPEMLDAWGTVWSKLYRAALIKDSQAEFIDLKEIGTNEDSLFNLFVLYYARKLVFLNQPLYHYWRGNTNSLTTRYKENLHHQFFKLYNRFEQFIKEKKLNQDFSSALTNRICLNTLGLGFNAISDGPLSSNFEKIKRLNLLLQDERIKNSFKNFELSHFPFHWRVFYFCAKSRFTLGFYLLLQAAEMMRKSVR